ncbi:hypothetical protein BLNAU_3322 [Blattamonas nauphoetae]|uniref:Uncharacterized protein n=1 Tax=Blattamonas nauphoetae TaxID=2049346 RepID=A0ABQ9YDP1_9EUKA|nr:hypothetical protein BLNAU_3322 [Blattamonas nauphoetae]
MIYEKTGTGTHHGAVLCPLERLLLASHLLTSVPLLVSQFRKLFTLSPAGNEISELPRHFFRSLPNLSRLDLSFNELTHLPESIGSGNTKQISLDVSFNILTSLPHFLVDSNDSQHSSQFLSLRQRFFGTYTTHTPATPTLASPIALTLDGAGSRPYGFGGGMESLRCQSGHLIVSLNGFRVGGVENGMETGLDRPPWNRNTSLRVFHAEFIRCLLRRLGREKQEEKVEKEKEEWEKITSVSETEHEQQFVHVGNHIRAYRQQQDVKSPSSRNLFDKFFQTAKETIRKGSIKGQPPPGITTPLSPHPDLYVSPLSSPSSRSPGQDGRLFPTLARPTSLPSFASVHSSQQKHCKHSTLKQTFSDMSLLAWPRVVSEEDEQNESPLPIFTPPEKQSPVDSTR